MLRLSCDAMIERQAPLLTQFGKYLLDGEIATGGMSKVFRARLRGPGGFEKRLVVKQILPQLAQDPNFIRMFVQEANTLVQMSHPNIVPVYELGVVDGVYFLAMELVEGATLAEILREGPLPEALVAHFGVQICEALHYAHDRFAVIHRDVTPRNLVIDDAGHARLLDFGIAAPADQAGRFGSVGYMSPEQARGLPVGPESDLFSVGTLLFEALSGTPAYLRDTPEATRRALLDDAAPVLDERTASSALRTLVARCLARDVDQRPRSAAEVAKLLRGWLAAHHPAGVAEELGRRAHEARERQQARAQSDQLSTSDEIRGVAPAPGKSRTLATSPILDQLLQQGTERIARSTPPPATTPTQVTSTHATSTHATPEIDGPMAVTAPIQHTTPIASIPAPSTASTSVPSTGDASTTTPRWVVALGAVVVITIGIWALAPTPPSRPLTPPASTSSTSPASSTTSTRATREPSAIEQTAAATNTTNTTTTTPITPSPAPAIDAATLAAATPAGSRTTTPAGADGGQVSNVSTRGWLMINALPWADVKLDGRTLGSTPLRKVAAEGGRHTLDLQCPPLGRSARVQITAKAGETLRVLVDLNQEPPSITLK